MDERIKQFLACEKVDYTDFQEQELNTVRDQLQKIKGEKPSFILESGITNGHIAKAYVGYIQRLIQCRLDLRRKYARDEPGLLSNELLSDLERDLKAIIASTATNYIGEDERFPLEAYVTRAIHRFRIKRDLGLKDAPEGTTVVININNSTIAALNLGTVIGDINATVTSLQSQGHKDLAEAIKTLTEAIAKDEHLGNERTGMIESLATIGEQAALPEEKRKVGVVKTLLTSLGTGLRASADVAKIWDVFGPEIASYFHIAFTSLGLGS